MSKQYPGGLITKTPVTPSGPYSNDTASGIWTLDQQAYWQKLGQWPTAGNNPVDPQFNYVTMLLHGDGTNGAQNNTFLDSSTNNFTITRNGNTTQGSFSPYGADWSNYFNSATPDYFSVANNTALQFGTGDFTIECWVYLNAFASDVAATLCKRSSAAEDTTWAIDFAAGTGDVRYRILNSTGGVITVSIGTVSLGTWAHIAVSKQSGTTRTYLNGVAGGTTTNSTSIDGGTNNLRIGVGDVGANKYINGYISNARLVKGTAVYTAAFTPSTTPLTAVSGTSLLTCQSNRFIDNSTNNFALTATGTPSVQRFNPFGASAAYSTSVIGGSGYFDAVNDTLATPTSTALNMRTGAFQIDFWMYPTASPGQFMGPFGTNNAGGNGGIFFANRSGNLDFTNNYDTAGVISTPYPRLNEWHHIALVRNSSNVRSFYLDGVRVGSLSNAVDFDQTQFIIGAYNASFGGWPGYVSNFRAIIGSNIADPTLSTITVPTTPNTAVANTQLLLDFTNGAIFDNAMMNDLETVGNAQISTSVVKYGTGSLAFDGTGDWLACTAKPNLLFASGDFTIECWIYINSYTSYGIACGTWNAGEIQNWVFRQYSTTGRLMFTTASSLGEINLTSTNSIGTGAWAHIAVTRSGSTLRLFINGTLDGSTTSTATLTSTSNYFSVGGTGGVNPDAMNGYIDDLRITKGYARYTANFTPPTAAFFNYGPT